MLHRLEYHRLGRLQARPVEPGTAFVAYPPAQAAIAFYQTPQADRLEIQPASTGAPRFQAVAPVINQAGQGKLPITVSNPIAVIRHTHWDDEWHHTRQELRPRLVRLLDGALAGLEKEKTACFELDAHAFPLEQYLQVRPEKLRQIQKFVSQGRMSVGPWYVQPDEFLVSGESLLRNLQLGMETAMKMGQKPENFTGYLPDIFGHSAEIPTILNAAGIKTAMMWRGVAPQRPWFFWESPSGERVLAYHMTSSYSQAIMHNPNRPWDGKVKRLQEYMTPILKQARPTDPIMFPVGHDHLGYLDNATEKFRTIYQSSAREGIYETTTGGFMRDGEARLRKGQLGELRVNRGELNDRTGNWLLSGVLSSRMYLKQYNRQLEWRLGRQLEQLLTWQKMLGFNPNMEHEIKEALWKPLLQNHPHDSICGCSADRVHEDNELRFKHVDEISKTMIRQMHKNLQTALKQDDTGAMLVLNLGDKPYTGVVEIERDYPYIHTIADPKDPGKNLRPRFRLPAPTANSQLLSEEKVLHKTDISDPSWNVVSDDVDIKRKSLIWVSNLPAHGYLKVHQAQTPANPVKATASTLDNGLVKVSITPKTVDGANLGWLKKLLPRPVYEALQRAYTFIMQGLGRLDGNHWGLTITDTRTGRRYSGLHQLWQNAEKGDSYHAAPVLKKDWLTGKYKVQKQPAILEDVSLVENQQGPLRATLKLTYRFPGNDMPVETFVSLDAGSPMVSFRTVFTNNQPNHKIQAVFQMPRPITEVTAEGHISPIKRQYDPNYRIEDHMPAKPGQELLIPNGAIQKFVGVQDQTLLTEGLTEYEVEGNQFKVTLFRAFGDLSRDDTGVRGNHAGPPVETPEGQCLGRRFELRYAWAPGFDPVEAYNQADRLYGAVYGFDRSGQAKPQLLPPQGQSFFTWDNPNVHAGASVPQPGQAWHLRLFNPTSSAQDVNLKLRHPNARITQINLVGGERKPLQQPRLTLGPYQIRTLEIQP